MMTIDIDLLDTIPRELKSLKQWAVYDSHGFKYPESGLSCDSDEFAITGLEKYEYCFSLLKQKKYEGIALYINEKNLYTIIELMEGGDKKKYSEIINKIGSYTESNCDGGYTIVTKASITHNINNKNIKLSNKNFFKMTGDKISASTDVIEAQGYVSQIFSDLVGDEFDKVEDVANIDMSTLEKKSDKEVIDEIKESIDSDKFQRLWFSDWKTICSSEADAKFNLVSIISKYTKSDEQINRIFALSEIGIEKDNLVEKMVKKVVNKVDYKLDIDTTHDVEWPKGRLGQFAQYIFDSSRRQNRTVSLLGALSIPLGICARNFSISDGSLNAYYMLLANTGIGKDEIQKARHRLHKEIKYKLGNEIEKCQGPANFASGEGMLGHANRQSKCFMSIMSEVSGVLKRISRPNRTTADESLRTILLSFYDYGSQTVHPTAYSKEKDTPPPIERPNMTIIGESNPDDLYDSLNDNMIKSGLLPRFIIVETQAPRELNNPNAGNVQIPPDLLNFFVQLSQYCFDCNAQDIITEVMEEQEAKDKSAIIDEETTRIINEDPKNVSATQLLNRVQLKVYRLSALLAIFDVEMGADGKYDFSQPLITGYHVDYANRIIMKSATELIGKYGRGEIGLSENDESKMNIEITEAMKTFIDSSYDKVKSYQIKKITHTKQVIPASYLIRRCASKSCFKSHRLGATLAIKNALKNLVDRDEIIQVVGSELSKAGIDRQLCYKLKHKFKGWE